VLLGQDLGGRHERRLVAVLHGSSMAKSATTVLPEPTSPCSSRFMRRGAVMSAKISASTRVCAPVSSNGSARYSGAMSVVRARERDAPAARRVALPHAGVQQLQEEQLIEGQAAAAALRVAQRLRPVQRTTACISVGSSAPP
jgi:hypothetical protein